MAWDKFNIQSLYFLTKYYYVHITHEKKFNGFEYIYKRKK